MIQGTVVISVHFWSLQGKARHHCSAPTLSALGQQEAGALCCFESPCGPHVGSVSVPKTHARHKLSLIRTLKSLYHMHHVYNVYLILDIYIYICVCVYFLNIHIYICIRYMIGNIYDIIYHT